MFKWNAADYANNSSVQLTFARELIEKLQLTGSESILDVGCGDGKITAEIAQFLTYGYILGIDSSPEMINYAQEQFSISEFPNLQFLCMNAANIQLNKKFDILFSNASLHWLEDHQAFLAGANQTLQPGGRLYISCGGKGNIEEISNILAEVMNYITWKDYFKDFQYPWYFYDVNPYENWLLKSGFKPIQVELIPKDAIFAGKEGLLGWLRTVGMPYTQFIPDDKKNDFMNDVADLYIKNYPLDNEGNCHLKMIRLLVDAMNNFSINN